jgi:hypothetical protein
MSLSGKHLTNLGPVGSRRRAELAKCATRRRRRVDGLSLRYARTLRHRPACLAALAARPASVRARAQARQRGAGPGVRLAAAADRAMGRRRRAAVGGAHSAQIRAGLAWLATARRRGGDSIPHRFAGHRVRFGRRRAVTAYPRVRTRAARNRARGGARPVGRGTFDRVRLPTVFQLGAAPLVRQERFSAWPRALDQRRSPARLAQAARLRGRRCATLLVQPAVQRHVAFLAAITCGPCSPAAICSRPASGCTR